MGGWMPSSVLSRVDLPEPLAPRMAVKLPRAMESEMPESTGWLS
jgi:hypothetical protein